MQLPLQRTRHEPGVPLHCGRMSGCLVDGDDAETSYEMLTMGDAMATFLQRPDDTAAPEGEEHASQVGKVRDISSVKRPCRAEESWNSHPP